MWISLLSWFLFMDFQRWVTEVGAPADSWSVQRDVARGGSKGKSTLQLVRVDRSSSFLMWVWNNTFNSKTYRKKPVFMSFSFKDGGALSGCGYTAHDSLVCFYQDLLRAMPRTGKNLHKWIHDRHLLLELGSSSDFSFIDATAQECLHRLGVDAVTLLASQDDRGASRSVAVERS